MDLSKRPRKHLLQRSHWQNNIAQIILSERRAPNDKLQRFLNEQMKDPEFKAEWDALDPEFSVIEAMLKARKESGLTQKQLSERTGIAQTDISKLERGNANPSLRTLQRLAAGMGMKVKIEFVPASAK